MSHQASLPEFVPLQRPWREDLSRNTAGARTLAIVLAVTVQGLFVSLLIFHSSAPLSRISSGARDLAVISIQSKTAKPAEDHRNDVQHVHSQDQPSRIPAKPDPSSASVNTMVSGSVNDSPGGSAAAPTTGISPAISADIAAEFQRQLLEHIEKYRQYPAQVGGQRPVGVSQVIFAMDRNGIVLGIWLKASSGSYILDKEAIQTVLRAQPLPPIPDALPDPLNISLPIEFGSNF